MKTSPVWSFFEQIGDKSRCRLCDHTYQTRGGGTSILRTHLEKHHKDKFDAELKKRTDETAERMETFSTSKDSIADILQNKGRLTISADKQKLLNDLVFNMVVENNLSFSFTESESFRNLMAISQPLYKIPCKKKLFGSYMEEQVGLYKELIRKKVSGRLVAISCDEWSQLHSTNSLLSITLHFLDASGKRQNFIAGCLYLSDLRHNAKNYASVVENCLSDLDIPLKNVVACVRDGASVMPAFTRELKITRSIHCGNHVTQLCITDVLYDGHFGVKVLLDKIRKIVGTIRRSTVFTNAVISIQKAKMKPKRKLIMDVKTRWSSLLLMIKRIVEQYEVVNELSNQNAKNSNLSVIDAGEVVQLKDLERILEKFHQANEHFSMADCTVVHTSLVFHMISTDIKLILNEGKLSPEMTEIAETLLEAVSKRKPCYTSFEAMCSMIDPRVAFIEIFDEFEWDYLVGKVGSLLVEYHCDIFKEPEVILESEEPAEKISRGIFSSLDKPKKVSETDNCSHAIKTELALYKSYCLAKKKHPNLSSDPGYVFKFWQTTGVEFKFLKKFAITALTTPASSIESERLFSLAGLISTNKLRNRMSGKKLEELCFLVSNRKHGLLAKENGAIVEESLEMYGKYFANRLIDDNGEEEDFNEDDEILSEEL